MAAVFIINAWGSPQIVVDLSTFLNCHVHFCLCIDENEPAFLGAVHSPCRSGTSWAFQGWARGISLGPSLELCFGGTSFARQDDSLCLEGELLHGVTGLQVSCGWDTLGSWSWLTLANEGSLRAPLPDSAFRDVSSEYQQTLQTSLQLV